MLKVALRGLVANKVRLVATALAVLLGVAFVTGTNVLAASVSKGFDTVFSDVYQNIDTVVRSTVQVRTPFGPQRARIDGSIVPAIAEAPGVAAVEGQVEGDLRVVGRDGELVGADRGPSTFGLNWLTEPSLNGWRLIEGEPPTSRSDVVLDEKTAADGGYSIGDEVAVAVQQGVRMFTLVGLAEFGPSGGFDLRAALFETRTAQELVGELGRFDFISVAGEGGTSQNELRAIVSGALPPEVETITGDEFVEENQDNLTEAIGLVERILLVFGYVALGVGAFIIYNTFAIIIAQRNRELALLRALGASRAQVLRSVVIEAFSVGLIASAIGIGIGTAIGIGLKTALESLGFGLTSIPTVVRPGDVAAAMAIGTIVTTSSALFPAVRASRVSPLAALREVAYDHGVVSWKRTVFGSLLLVSGVVLVVHALAFATDDTLLAVGRGVAVVFIAVVILGPVVARPLSRFIGAPLPLLGRVTGRLARENAMRNPQRTAATASALMIGVGLVGFIAVVAASAETSIADGIDRAVGADIVITTSGGGGGPGNGLSPALADEIAESPTVDAVSRQRLDFAEVAGSGQFVIAVDPTAFAQIVQLDMVAGSFTELEDGGVAVPAAVADAEGWSLGTRLPARFLQQTEAVLPVVAIYETDLPVQGSGLFISTALFDRTFPITDQVDDLVYVRLAPGVSGEDGMAALEPIVDRNPIARMQDLDQFKQDQIDEINQFLLVVYALLALALVIAIIGIINTLLLSVYERTHEVGLLRAIGTRRGQIGAVVCWEAVLIALIGTALGLAVAVFFGWAIVQALEDEGVRLFAVPWDTMVAIIVLAALAGFAAALYPAHRASRLDVLDAIATE